MQTERSTTPIIRKIITLCISLIFLAIQIAFYYMIFFASRKIPFLYTITKILGVIVVISLLDQNMSSSYKVIWAIIVLLFPFAGTMFYLLFANQRTFPKRKNKKIHRFLDPLIPKTDGLKHLKSNDMIGYKHALSINSANKLPVYEDSKVDFFNDITQKHEKMLNDIRNAKRYIFLEFFVVSDGKMLDSIIEVLKVKANEGLEIKFCYDDIGSKRSMNSNIVQKIKQIPHIELVKYEPLGITFNPAVNYRDHRKLVIIDGNIAYVGGDNLADEYANWIERFGHWRDNCFRIEGEAVETLLFLFAEIWYMSTKKVINIETHRNFHEQFITNSFIMPFGDGPTDEFNPGYDLFTSFANNAQNYLYISTPYLIIDVEFINSICLAAKSGIDVRILVPGIPDKKIIFRLTESHYRSLLKAGVKIYEYTPGFNHAKNYIVDDKYAYCGSMNVDYRSLYLHFENGILVMNDPVVLKMKSDFLDAIGKSHEVTYENWKKRSLFQKLCEFILRIFAPLV